MHDNSKLSNINELTMCYDIKNKVALDPQLVKDLPEDQKSDVITGTLDDLIRINGEYVIVDKKTWNNKWGYEKKAADPFHMLQVQVYTLQLFAAYGIHAKLGCILYLDKADGLCSSQFIFPTDPFEKIQEFLEVTLAKLKQDLPEANPSTFLCNRKNREGKVYCPYIDECKKAGGGAS